MASLPVALIWADGKTESWGPVELGEDGRPPARLGGFQFDSLAAHGAVAVYSASAGTPAPVIATDSD